MAAKSSETQETLVESATVQLTGGCMCGAVRYQASAMPFASDYCHCDSCRRSSGAPVTAWMDFLTEQVSIQGEIAEFKSSEKIYRGFCPHCGSRLSFRHEDYSNYTTLTVTSLDSPNLVSPTYHIFTEETPTWLTITDDLPRYLRGQPSYSGS